MEHIISNTAPSDMQLVVVTEPNGRQMIGLVDREQSQHDGLRVGAIVLHRPLLFAEQQSGGRVGAIVGPILHGMVVNTIKIQATSMFNIPARNRYRDLYEQQYETMTTAIRAAEAGLISPEGHALPRGK